MILWNKVKTWRDANVDCKWSKIKGKPVMTIRPSHSTKYYVLDKKALDIINDSVKKGKTIKEAVNIVYGIADIFHIPV